MPERPREHEIEEESRIAFEAALGRHFKYRGEAAPEYGVDGTVEVFDESGQATALRFHVQLKGTDEEKLSKSLGRSIRRDTISYLQAHALPVLMVRYRAVDKTLYVRWLHQFDPSGSLGEKTVTFRWQPEDLFDETTGARLVEEAEAYLHLRSPALALPLDLYLETPGDGAYAFGRPALLFALRDAAEQTNVFEVRGADPPPGAIRVIAEADRLSVNLADVTTLTMEATSYDPGETGEVFASDVMTMAALTFARIGRTDAATSLTAAFLEQSSLATDPEAAWSLSIALRASRRTCEALRIARSLDASDDAARREASMLFVLAARWHVESWSKEELEEYRKLMEDRISRRIDRGERATAGSESYNLANVLRSRREPERALEFFDRVVQLDPSYADRAYFHEERAGVLFGSGRFEDAVETYARAHEIKPDIGLIGLRADALMFAGRYEEALEAFRLHSSSGADEAEWRIKERFLSAVVEQFGTPSQQRDVEGASSATDLDYTGTPLAELANGLDAAIQLDALCPVAWFNLGRVHLDLGKREAALVDYLGAAACQPADAESWMNVLILGIDIGQLELAAEAVECGVRKVGQAFRQELLRWARHPASGNNGDHMLRIVDEISERLRADEERDAMLLRFQDEESGEIAEIVLRGETE